METIAIWFYTANDSIEKSFSMAVFEYGQLSYPRITQDCGISITLESSEGNISNYTCASWSVKQTEDINLLWITTRLK